MSWQNPPYKKKPRKAEKPFLGKNVRVPESICNECGHTLDSATAFGHNSKPRSGNLSICVKCSHLYIFGKDLKLRELNAKEMVKWAGSPELTQLTEAIGRTRIALAIKQSGKRDADR